MIQNRMISVFFDQYKEEYGIEFKDLKTNSNADTAMMAHGCDGVCAFVNDDLNADTIETLYENGFGLSQCGAQAIIILDFKKALEKFTYCAYRPIHRTLWRSIQWRCCLY